jgi:hypothetical protein
MPASVPTGGGASRYYYQVYVGQDPSWNLIASGWVNDPSQARGAGELAAAQYNLQTQTIVYDSQANPPSWGAWQTAMPAGGQPDLGPNPTVPTPSDTSASASDVTGTVVKAAVAVGLVALAAWVIRRGARSS